MSLDDATLTEILGPKCPDCGWRRGQHRPAGEFVAPCPTLAPPVPTAAAGPIQPDRKCDASGMTILACKRSDLCDCWDYPEWDRALAEEGNR